MTAAGKWVYVVSPDGWTFAHHIPDAGGGEVGDGDLPRGTRALSKNVYKTSLPGCFADQRLSGVSHLRITRHESSVCVSTVSIVGGRDGGPFDRAREIAEQVVVADIIGGSRPELS